MQQTLRVTFLGLLTLLLLGWPPYSQAETSDEPVRVARRKHSSLRGRARRKRQVLRRKARRKRASLRGRARRKRQVLRRRARRKRAYLRRKRRQRRSKRRRQRRSKRRRLPLCQKIFCAPWRASAGRKPWYLWKRYRERYHEPLLERCYPYCKGKIYRMRRRRVNRLLRHLKKTMGYHERLRVLSAMFLGNRYRLGPLGEGPKGRWDRDPIFRLDRVDCVTYVESVMALAMSRSVSQAIRKMQKIRYKNGVIRYGYRNHFTAAQWLPENQRAGYTRTMTASWGGKYTRYVTKKISARTWRRSSWRRWSRRIPASLLPRSYRFAYIPLRFLPRVVKKLPKISWLGEVKYSPGSPVSVQHVGFVVRKGGQVYFRDANVVPGVSDRTLLSYTRFRRRQWSDPERRYRILGFAFAAFVDIDKKR